MFLIIGAILSFLQRGREQEAKKETEQRGSGNGDAKQTEIDWREIFRQEADFEPKQQKQRQQTYTYTEEPQTSTEGFNRSNELLEKYEKAKRDKKVAERKIGGNLKDSPIYKDDITAQRKIELDFSSISSEEAVKGVVWSEILGKPRAKGSYRPSINMRRRRQG